MFRRQEALSTIGQSKQMRLMILQVTQSHESSNLHLLFCILLTVDEPAVIGYKVMQQQLVRKIIVSDSGSPQLLLSNFDPILMMRFQTRSASPPLKVLNKSQNKSCSDPWLTVPLHPRFLKKKARGRRALRWKTIPLPCTSCPQCCIGRTEEWGAQTFLLGFLYQQPGSFLRLPTWGTRVAKLFTRSYKESHIAKEFEIEPLVKIPAVVAVANECCMQSWLLLIIVSVERIEARTRWEAKALHLLHVVNLQRRRWEHRHRSACAALLSALSAHEWAAG